MKKTRSDDHVLSLEEILIPSFGYELVREELLTNILGKDAPDILYWSGKRLARSYPLDSLSDIIQFFERAGWGELAIKREASNEISFTLTSPLIIHRLQQNKDSHFKLETGFLAQQIELQTEMLAEAYEQIHKKVGLVEIIVRWDKKDRIHE
ncbi:YslB family protein [Neobacillus sp. D3-1R]|uniref:YslB family protein n=1 Tax=Neobacillus sp. D3-1R TaxID=3445778 RepID=UPI003F9F5849